MKKLYLHIILTILLLPYIVGFTPYPFTLVPHDAHGWYQRIETVLPYGGLATDLYAPFSVADFTATNGQVLYSTRGVQSGSLTVVDTSTGTGKVVGKELEITGTGGWNTTGAYKTVGVTKALGKAFFSINTYSTRDLKVGWNEGAAITDANSVGFNLTAGADIVMPITDSLTSTTAVSLNTLSVGTDYKLLTLAGGFDTNQIPFKTGDTIGDFLYGWHYFIKGGPFTTWTQLWTTNVNNDSPMYPYLQVHTATATLFDDLLVPTLPLNVDTMFQPLFLDTFNTGTGSLDARQSSIDVDSSGNGWTQRVGDADWRIDTATAELGVAGTNPVKNADYRHAYVDVGVSDFIFTADVRFDSTIRGANGLIFRGSAATGNGENQWIYWFDYNGQEILYQVEDGSPTVRDTAAHGAVNQTVYKITAIANGTTIRIYRDGALKLEYTSATFNQTATQMGIRADGRQLTDKAFDNVTIFPTTDSDWDAEISAKTGNVY